MPGPIGLRTLRDHLVTTERSVPLPRAAYTAFVLFEAIPHTMNEKLGDNELFGPPKHGSWWPSMHNEVFPNISKEKSISEAFSWNCLMCFFNVLFVFDRKAAKPERSRGVNKMLLAKANQDHKGRFNLLTSKHFLIPQFCFWTWHTRSFGKS